MSSGFKYFHSFERNLPTSSTASSFGMFVESNVPFSTVIFKPCLSVEMTDIREQMVDEKPKENIHTLYQVIESH